MSVHNKRYIIRKLQPALLLIATLGSVSFGTPADELSSRQIQLEKDLSIQNQKNLPKTPDIHTQTITKKTNNKLEPETPCFDIRKIELQGDKGFNRELSKTLDVLDIKPKINLNNSYGICVGQKGVLSISNTLQNFIIARGYTTTKVFLKEQDLKSQVLKIDILAGMVDKIRFDEGANLQLHEQDASLFSAMPLKSGDILNIRPIEQALENLKRIPNTDASFEIVPSKKSGYSDVVIKYQKSKFPFRMSFSINDSGSKSTGRYQGGATLSADNLLGLNDIFYYSYTNDVGGYNKLDTTDGNGVINGHTNGISNSMALHYSFPIGYFLLSLNASNYHYDQAVAGANQVYRYAGNSKTKDLAITRVVNRNDTGKTTLSLKGSTRSSDSFIDDARVTVQDRKTTSMEYGVMHREFMGDAILDMALRYKVGIGALDPLKAPEEEFGEGVSRPRIWSADVSLSKPLIKSEKQLNFTTSLHAQTTSTHLVVQDRIAIGGRSSVRGFDGELSLSSNRGFYLQNELAYGFVPSHQIYLAFDGGKVYGQSVQDLLGQSLIGTALGFRGSFAPFGTISYDIFAGTPLYKPQGFQTSSVALGFNINYSF